jgi:hypothetical protein
MQNATLETTMNEHLCSTQRPKAALLLCVGEPSICPSAVLKGVRILILSEAKVRKVMPEVSQRQLKEGENNPTLLLGL